MTRINVTPSFVLAGEATFTVSNSAGKHYTYHVYRTEPTDQWPNRSWFIKLLTGPNNETDYQYMGRLRVKVYTRTPVIELTSKSRFIGSSAWLASTKGIEASQAVKVAQWALKAIWHAEHHGYIVPAHMSIKHEGKCGRCGAKLTTPASIDTGMGEKCAIQAGIEWRERSGERTLDFSGPNTRRTKDQPGPNRRKGPRTVHTIDEHTSARDYELARQDLVSFFDPSKHHGGR